AWKRRASSSGSVDVIFMSYRMRRNSSHVNVPPRLQIGFGPSVKCDLPTSGCSPVSCVTSAIASGWRRRSCKSANWNSVASAAPYANHELLEHFRHNAFFIGPNVREAVDDGVSDYTADI